MRRGHGSSSRGGNTSDRLAVYGQLLDWAQDLRDTFARLDAQIMRTGEPYGPWLPAGNTPDAVRAVKAMLHSSAGVKGHFQDFNSCVSGLTNAIFAVHDQVLWTERRQGAIMPELRRIGHRKLAHPWVLLLDRSHKGLTGAIAAEMRTGRESPGPLRPLSVVLAEPEYDEVRRFLAR